MASNILDFFAEQNRRGQAVDYANNVLPQMFPDPTPQESALMKYGAVNPDAIPQIVQTLQQQRALSGIAGGNQQTAPAQQPQQSALAGIDFSASAPNTAPQNTSGSIFDQFAQGTAPQQADQGLSMSPPSALASMTAQPTAPQPQQKTTLQRMAAALPYLPPAVQTQVASQLAMGFGDTQNGSAGGATGKDLLDTLPPGIKPQVQGLIEGKINLTGMALKTPYWQQMLSLANQVDPSFDMANYQARAATQKDFTSGKSAQNITALNTAMGHLSSLSDAYKNLDNTDYPLYNKVANAAGNAFGNTEIQTATSDVGSKAHAVSEELAKVFRSTGMAESDVKAWEDKIDTSSSPAQSKAIIKSATDLMDSRLEALGQQYSQGMGTTKNGIELLSPHAQEAYYKLTGKQPPETMAPPVRGTTGAVSPLAALTLPSDPNQGPVPAPQQEPSSNMDAPALQQMDSAPQSALDMSAGASDPRQAQRRSALLAALKKRGLH